MSLQQEILSWDKKSKAVIQSVHDRFGHDSQFLGQLVALLETPEAQCGATWLIKHHVENGLGLPDAKQVAVILNQAQDMAEWTSRLHVLQAIHHMQIPDSSRETANRLFRSLLDDPNKFVRAWAYSALAWLATQYEQYREEVFLLLHEGLDVEVAGSIRARLNKALKMITRNH